MNSKMLLGQNLGKQLTEILGLPKNTTRIELHIGVDEVVRVNCWYYAEIDSKNLAEVFAEYELKLKSKEVDAKVSLFSENLFDYQK